MTLALKKKKRKYLIAKILLAIVVIMPFPQVLISALIYGVLYIIFNACSKNDNFAIDMPEDYVETMKVFLLINSFGIFSPRCCVSITINLCIVALILLFTQCYFPD